MVNATVTSKPSTDVKPRCFLCTSTDHGMVNCVNCMYACQLMIGGREQRYYDSVSGAFNQSIDVKIALLLHAKFVMDLTTQHFIIFQAFPEITHPLAMGPIRQYQLQQTLIRYNSRIVDQIQWCRLWETPTLCLKKEGQKDVTYLLLE